MPEATPGESPMCQHFVDQGECVLCDPRQHVVLACPSCSRDGGQTWHVIEGETAETATATCRKCGSKRPASIKGGDIGIRSF